MPSGLSMTILVMNNIQLHEYDDIAIKFTLKEIKDVLDKKFECIVPAVPNDDIFDEFSISIRDNVMNKLSAFIDDAQKACNEKNELKASELWREHLGDRFPAGQNVDSDSDIESIKKMAGTSKPYYEK